MSELIIHDKLKIRLEYNISDLFFNNSYDFQDYLELFNNNKSDIYEKLKKTFETYSLDISHDKFEELNDISTRIHPKDDTKFPGYINVFYNSGTPIISYSNDIILNDKTDLLHSIELVDEILKITEDHLKSHKPTYTLELIFTEPEKIQDNMDKINILNNLLKEMNVNLNDKLYTSTKLPDDIQSDLFILLYENKYPTYNSIKFSFKI